VIEDLLPHAQNKVRERFMTALAEDLRKDDEAGSQFGTLQLNFTFSESDRKHTFDSLDWTILIRNSRFISVDVLIYAT
jgi:hypothetical protein